MRRSYTTLFVLSSALLGLALAWPACVAEESPDVLALELRDVLGLEPQWVDKEPASEKERLKKELSSTIVAQSEDASWVELPAELAEAEGEIGPSRALVRLDEVLVNEGRDPILVFWGEMGAEGPIARACPLTPEELSGELDADRGEWARGWHFDEGFEVPLTEGEEMSEREALDALLPRIELWIARCAEAAGPNLAPEAERTRLEVLRAESAPTLLAWWPGRRTIYINPLILHIFGESKELEPSTTRAFTQALIPSDSFGACVESVIDFCDRCGDVAIAGIAGCDETLLNAVDPQQGCRELQRIPQGYAQFCVNHLLFDLSSLDICVDSLVSDPDCALQSPTRSLISLDGRYETFVQNTVCTEALSSCAAGAEPRPDNNGVPSSPPPSENDSTDTNCCEDAVCIGAEICAESGAFDDLCSGLGEGACSDGCEGDSGGGDCGGCEGDTF